MSNFLHENLDFVYLIYGLTLFILALTAGSMGRRRRNGAAWAFFCAFGIINGLSAWLEMLNPMLGGFRWYSLLRAGALITAFYCLFEFGRRSIVWNRKWKAGIWIYLPSLFVVLLGSTLFPEDFLALVRFNFVFPAGLLAALALWRSAKLYHDEPAQWPMALGPLALGLYSVSIGLILPSAHFWPVNYINEEWFITKTGVPIQLWRCLLAGTVALAFWREYSRWRIHYYPRDFSRRFSYVRWVSFVAIIVIIISGWILVERADRHCREDYQHQILSVSRGMAAVINAHEISGLSGTRSDIETPLYQSLRLQCQRICEADPGFRYVYLMVMRGDKVVFLLDTEPKKYARAAGKPTARPGDVYECPPSEIFHVFKTATAEVSKPYLDAWGMFVSGYAPIMDFSTGAVIAVIGIDTLGAQWLEEISSARLLRLLLTGGAILLLLLFSVLWRREIEESQIRGESGRRMQLQQSALLNIANAKSVADGNIFMMSRNVTQLTAQVLDVKRVDLWLKGKNDGAFRAEDIYHTHSGAHAAGQISGITEGAAFLKLLEEGRVALSSRFQGDERFDTVKEEWGKDVLSVLVAPLRTSGQLVGWLSAIETNLCRIWLTDEMRFIAEMADQVVHTLINDERRLAEEAQRKAHDELELRVRERTEALSQKNDELSREITERMRIESEQRALQDKMQQAQKLESLGLMAGGIAHDFNNILMAVLGNVELARLESPEGSPVYEYLQDIDKAACRAADLARQMLIYSGRGHASIQGIYLDEMMRDMTSILKVSLGKKIQIVYDLEPSLPLVDGDLTQMRQVLMNLVINASEAIGKESGVITLRTGVIQYDKAQFSSMWLKEELPDGKYVFLDVLDTGCGMSEATLKRIFDPFYTTKFTGRGLGLAAVLGIIKGHNGTIDVSSQLGKGTRFRVILPIGRRAAKKGALAQHGDGVDWKGEGGILLVDDEPTIRSLGRRMLERMGFSVIEANDGSEAIALFKLHHASIRCVLLDLTMPEVTGKEVFNGIRLIDSAAKIVLCSGYMEQNMVGKFAEWKISGFLQKPYKYEALATLLRKVLNG